jgi:hypothetical protein
LQQDVLFPGLLYRPAFTASPSDDTYSIGNSPETPSFGPTGWRVDTRGYTSREDAWDRIHGEQFSVRSERLSFADDSDGKHRSMWAGKLDRGDTVFVWAHGWGKGGVYDGPSARRATWKGRINAGLAFDAMDYYTDICERSEDDDNVHTVGFAWNSGSAALNFNSAVGQAATIGPNNFAPVLDSIADHVGPEGTIHVGAHSLGAWMTLEALAKVSTTDDMDTVGEALESVRFICGAVPESALTTDSDWVGCQNNSFGSDCSGSDGWGSETYDEHALQVPERVVNSYYTSDGVLSEDGDTAWYGAPFQLYLENYGSSSDAIGATAVSTPGSVDWENREAPGVQSHTGAYKHPAYGEGAGCGQNVLWAEWEDIGRDCQRAGGVDDCLYESGPRVRCGIDRGSGDRPDGERARRP